MDNKFFCNIILQLSSAMALDSSLQKSANCLSVFDHVQCVSPVQFHFQEKKDQLDSNQVFASPTCLSVLFKMQINDFCTDW